MYSIETLRLFCSRHQIPTSFAIAFIKISLYVSLLVTFEYSGIVRLFK